MATWHQSRRPVRLDHTTEWSVVIDPPGGFRHVYSTSTRQLAEVYMRGLKANNPGAAQHAYILPPRNTH